MTTAHRPTFDPARGKEAARGEAYHQRLLPAHKTLKFRQQGQGSTEEQRRRDLKAELLKNESKHFARKEGREIEDGEENDEEGGGDAVRERRRIEDSKPDPESDTAGVAAKRKLGDSSEQTPVPGQQEGEAEGEDYEAKKRRVLEESKAIDADSDGSSSSSDSEDEDDDEEDETAELMRELAKIKAERAETAAKEAAAKAAREESQREKDIALGNPLLNSQFEEAGGDYGVKRRWDDDVVFKNQARGTEERGKEKKFVNDLLRSDFHRRFMDKYVR
ncbi:hypothetical protein D0869_00317 [Hortaea werneckii]|uniref:Cwf15/Cwc15 cell cycle control protein n=1 Tax=Hortaea werneckii TaxID=91943 RepID=A0A3M6ZMD3_HORWE|nr:hypothetical protein KC334_g1743 [Hortaea werneckii]KAI7013011.1 hypothetical protein KC355_g5211 [Hortaea werneckii]KAI7205622.1 hypothetical protein KC324_g184 [Hortaea werneckii]KAI7595407.1 hypothetical protein KC316_g557 [Hortaea werneckii]RMX90180.1 hypothetical protein D0869_00317 [Hortaea werneckii]